MRSKRLAIGILFLFLFTAQAFAFGETKWEFKAFVASNITFHEDKMLFGDQLGMLYVLNKDSGEVIWTHHDQGPIIKTIAVVDDKVLYITSTGHVTCLNLEDGALIWDYTPSESADEIIHDGVVVGEGLAFVVKNDSKLYALDISTGKTVWTFQGNEQGLQTAPAYSEGLVFLGEYNGIFDIIDAETGERLNGGGAGGAINTPVVKDGVVCYSSWAGSVNAVQIKSVIPLWQVNIKEPITTSPVIAEGIIVVGTGRGFVTALSEKDGSSIWSLDCKNGVVTSKPIIANGKVYVVPEGGNVYEIEASSGKVLNTFETKGPVSSPAYSDGVLYFGNMDTLMAVKE